MSKKVFVLVHDYWHHDDSIKPMMDYLFNADYEVTFTKNPNDYFKGQFDLFLSFKDPIENDQIPTPIWCDEKWTEKFLNDIQNGIRGIQQGICDSTYSLNNTMQSGFNGMNVGMLQGFNGVQQAINADTVASMQNTNALQSQLANCCCETREAIQGINYNLATNTCALQNTMNNNTRDLLENQNSNTRAILDFLTNDKIATLQAENSDLKRAASQDRQSALLTTAMASQTQQLINAINPAPIPAFQVPAPYAYAGCSTYGNGCC